jgi:hypothetical protein
MSSVSFPATRAESVTTTTHTSSDRTWAPAIPEASNKEDFAWRYICFAAARGTSPGRVQDLLRLGGDRSAHARVDLRDPAVQGRRRVRRTDAAGDRFAVKQQGAPNKERAVACARPRACSTSSRICTSKVKSLSGGRRRRLAMGRAIVRKPAVYLMDEPLSNLDAELRVQTRTEVVELQARLAVTTLCVPHDQVEAMRMGHRVAVLCDGVLQHGRRPARCARRSGRSRGSAPRCSSTSRPTLNGGSPSAAASVVGDAFAAVS